MQATRRRDTDPEVTLRRLLYARGLRYRVDRAPLRGLRSRPDIVFGPSKVAVYVDGCFCPVGSERRLVLWVNFDQLECRYYLRIAYASQNEDAAGRAVRRSARLRRRLGCDTEWGAPVQKPKAIHWSTFLSLAQRIADAEGGQLNDLELLDHRNQAVELLLGHLGGPI